MMIRIYTGYMKPQETVVIPVSGDDYIEIIEGQAKALAEAISEANGGVDVLWDLASTGDA